MSNFLPKPGQPPQDPLDPVPSLFDGSESGGNNAGTDTPEDLVVPPAPATPGQKMSARYGAPKMAQAVDQFEADLGGRGKLVEILAGLAPDDKLVETLGLLADPSNDQIPLSRLCRAGGITLAELYEATRKGILVKPLLLALHQMADKIAPIVEDIMQRAAPHDVPCPNCQGTCTSPGATPDAPPIVCTACKGSGVTRVLPELDRQKLALELARLLPKKGVDTVVMGAGSVANLGGGTVGSMSSLLTATHQLPARPKSVGRGRTPRVPNAGAPVVTSPADVAGSPDPTHPLED